MKAKADDVVRRYGADPEKFRLVLLCGPNVTRCQALAEELAAPLAKEAERVDLAIGDLSENPARLHDEANSASLFGDKRYIILRLNSGEAGTGSSRPTLPRLNDLSGVPGSALAVGVIGLKQIECALGGSHRLR